MGLIKAITGAIGGSLADQWLEVIEADQMTDKTVMTSGVAVRKDDRRSSNTKGTVDTVSNGSVIQVYDNQFMMLLDGGKVVDYTAEPGYYQVNDSSLPSLFNGEFGEALKETFDRFRYGGVTPTKQKVVFINLQEIKNIKFGTKNPIQYWDNFYNAELFLRAFGNYSIKVTDPILFYQVVVDKSASRQEIDSINEQYQSEFLNALGASLNQMSADGIRISYVTSRSMELAEYMSDTLDKAWSEARGFEVQSVGIASVSYSDDSQELINMRNKGAMLGDPMVREGYVQGSIARGLEAAGSNEAGSAQTFMGLGMGMQAGGNAMGQASQANTQQWMYQQEQAGKAGGGSGGGAGTGEAGAAGGVATGGEWYCTDCGTKNAPGGKFCSNCGTPRQAAPEGVCSNCGWKIPEGQNPKFCPECGNKLRE